MKIADGNEPGVLFVTGDDLDALAALTSTYARVLVSRNVETIAALFGKLGKNLDEKVEVLTLVPILLVDI